MWQFSSLRDGTSNLRSVFHESSLSSVLQSLGSFGTLIASEFMLSFFSLWYFFSFWYSLNGNFSPKCKVPISLQWGTGKDGNKKFAPKGLSATIGIVWFVSHFSTKGCIYICPKKPYKFWFLQKLCKFHAFSVANVLCVTSADIKIHEAHIIF